jgi:hypothetical protein
VIVVLDLPVQEYEKFFIQRGECCPSPVVQPEARRRNMFLDPCVYRKPSVFMKLEI